MNPTMSTDPGTSIPAGPSIRPPLQAVAAALGEVNRWRILSELSAGEPLMVKELAERVGISADLASRHMAAMREAGLVEVGHARLYSIPKQYLPVPGQRLIDYGHCLLRLDATK